MQSECEFLLQVLCSTVVYNYLVNYSLILFVKSIKIQPIDLWPPSQDRNYRRVEVLIGSVGPRARDLADNSLGDLRQGKAPNRGPCLVIHLPSLLVEVKW